MSTPAPVYSLPSDAHQEAIDFLRRLSSMLTGGRNAEMLQEAAGLIETLSRRTAATEQLLGSSRMRTRATSSCAKWRNWPPTI